MKEGRAVDLLPVGNTNLSNRHKSVKVWIISGNRLNAK